MYNSKVPNIMYMMLFFLVLFDKSYSLKKQEVVVLKSFGTCDGHKVPNGFFNTSTDNIGRGNTVINGDMIINVPAKEVVGYFTVSKCLSSSKSSCEEVLSFDVPNLCERYLEKDQYYSSYTQKIEPKYECPLIKNTHFRLRNGTFDAATLIPLLNKIPFAHSGAYWLFRNITFRKKDKLELNCIDFFFKVEKLYYRPQKT